MDLRQEGDNNLGGLGIKTQLHNGLNIIAFFSYLSSLSNLHKAQFDVNQHRFNCSEQYFMFKRAKLFKKDDSAQRIMAEVDPKEIKQLGKAVIRNEKDREVWAKHKDVIMAEALAAKYSQDEFSRTDLLATYPYFLVEASPHDEYWGAGLSKERIVKSGRLGNGKNQLGIMLTALRQLIKNEAISFTALTPNPSAQQLREAAREILQCSEEIRKQMPVAHSSPTQAMAPVHSSNPCSEAVIRPSSSSNQASINQSTRKSPRLTNFQPKTIQPGLPHWTEQTSIHGVTKVRCSRMP